MKSFSLQKIMDRTRVERKCIYIHKLEESHYLFNEDITQLTGDETTIHLAIPGIPNAPPMPFNLPWLV